jgi:hypothetical protein
MESGEAIPGVLTGEITELLKRPGNASPIMAPSSNRKKFFAD